SIENRSSSKGSSEKRSGEKRSSNNGSTTLLPRTRLQPDTRHRFMINGQDNTEAIRLDIFPDGGMARLRLWGRLGPAAADRLTRRWIEALPPAEAARVLAENGRSVDALVSEVTHMWTK
ncbi:MAG TPA: hypothetical protein VFD73_10885, partial [Gemmatimonadales bacterium]|nr:hypothetical protein [Gemmatimonadales bacterium]